MNHSARKRGAIKIGEWVLLAELNLIRHGGSGKEVRLEPRHADLLAYFAAHRGEVLSTDDIIEHVWDRQIVSDQSVYQAIAKLRRAVGDSASEPMYIETVPKRGYRLIAEVDSSAPPDTALPSGDEDVPGPQDSAAIARRNRRRLGAGLVIAAAVFLLWLTLQPSTEPPTGTHETVAVLPFTILAGEAEDHFIAQGFSIELAHSLGFIDNLRIIGPISSRLATGLDGNLQELGRHIGADIVISGNIRPARDGFRVAGAITEVASGYQVWSGVFDSDGGEVLETQREVANNVAAALRKAIRQSESAKAAQAQPGQNQVYDSYLLGRYYRMLRTQADLERAQQYFTQTLELQADYLPAIRGMAATSLMLSFYGDTSLADALGDAEGYLDRIFAVAPEDPELLSLIGLSHYLQGNQGLAEEALMRAVAIHPNMPEAWMWLGLVREQQGRLNDAVPALKHASELEPLLVTSVVNYANALARKGQGQRALSLLQRLERIANDDFENRDQLLRVMSRIARGNGDLVKSHGWAEKALAAAPDSSLSLANLAAVSALLGDDDRARELAAKAVGDTTPGRGTLDYLIHASTASPGALDSIMRTVVQADPLRRRPDTPEIAWRLANLHTGMRHYFDGDLDLAIDQLEKAIAGRHYPVMRADDDLFVCGALVDALQRRGDDSAAQVRMTDCQQDLDLAQHNGWDTPSLRLGHLRLVILRGQREAAEGLMAELFDRGMRAGGILREDPVLSRLADTTTYRDLVEQIQNAVEAARRAIGTSQSD